MDPNTSANISNITTDNTPHASRTRSMSIQNLLADETPAVPTSNISHPTSIQLSSPYDFHNEDDVEAAMTLDVLRSAGSGQSTPSFTNASTATLATMSEYPITASTTSNDHFISRVQNIPFVNSALKAYEQTKANSRVVKYGADVIESSVKTISKPVMTKFNPQLGQLDSLACKTLDRLERRYPSMTTSVSPPERNSTEPYENAMSYAELEDYHRKTTMMDVQMGYNGPLSPTTSSSSHQGTHVLSPTLSEMSNPGNRERVAAVTTITPRNRWHTMLREAGTTAGGLSAAVSEESMKSLKYCLQWLQYATAHIDQQILMLRDTIASLNSEHVDGALVTQATANKLTNIKKEVVETIRKVVDIVSKYAGAALPEPARRTVRSFILTLPNRWASLNRVPQGNFPTNPHSTTSSTASAASEEAARRILSLATESLDMIRGVTAIVGDSLERAELWVERLRMMNGHQRRSGGNQNQLAIVDAKSSRSSSISSATSNSSRKRPRNKYLKDSSGYSIVNGTCQGMETVEDDSSNSESEVNNGTAHQRMEMHTGDARKRKTPKSMDVDV